MDDLILSKARLKILDAQKETPQKKEAKKKEGKHNQLLLLTALDTAITCVDYIPEEEMRVARLIQEIEKSKEDDPYWETRVNYHLHNLDVMKKTYPLYSEEAIRRKNHIETVNKKNKWKDEKDKCKQDTMYWFNHYAWTADPRKTGVWSLPFMLYDFQQEAVQWLEEMIFLKQASGGIDKSRDLGLSWLLTSLFYKHWQTPRDGAFNALMGSITSDECDKVGDPSSMFEKLRIQARLQPLGLLPTGWNCDIPYMKAVNPENGSTITGETSNQDFGRSGRYKVILFDEFSAFEQDTAAMTASSQSSPCKIYNSTARGMGNEFARLRHSGKVEWRTYHWTRHPYKTDAWYEYQKLEMNPVQVAQELDIDYNASQPNKVYGAYNEVYHVITESELTRALPAFKNPEGGFRIPLGHSIAMGYDVGQSDEHANALLWTVTLKQGTTTVDGEDVSGMVLVYREMMPSPHTTPRALANMIKEAEGFIESRMVYDRLISHERTTERDALDFDYGLYFRKWTSDYNGGIAIVRDYLEVTKRNRPHPFREPTRKLMYPDGDPIMGRPTMLLVVADGQGELKYEPSLNRYSCVPAQDAAGMVRLRGEFPAYHFPVTELGKEPKKMRPAKKLDDFMDVIRCIASEAFAPINPLTPEERFQNQLSSELKGDNLDKLSPEERGMAFLTIQHQRREFEKEEQRKYMSYRDQLWDKVSKR